MFGTQLCARLCGGPQLFQRPAHPFTSSLPAMLPGRLELHMRMHSGLRVVSQPPSLANPAATVPLSLHDCVVFLGLCLPIVAGKGMVEQIGVEHQQERVTARHSFGGPASSDLPPQPGHLPTAHSESESIGGASGPNHHFLTDVPRGVLHQPPRHFSV